MLVVSLIAIAESNTREKANSALSTAFMIKRHRFWTLFLKLRAKYERRAWGKPKPIVNDNYSLLWTTVDALRREMDKTWCEWGHLPFCCFLDLSRWKSHTDWRRWERSTQSRQWIEFQGFNRTRDRKHYCSRLCSKKVSSDLKNVHTSYWSNPLC